jgi:hypothetical protein
MSAWGIGVWENDVADDVILMFDDLCEADSSAQEALQGVLAHPPYGWGIQDDDAAQILSIAALALQHGLLDSAVRDRAIATIESGAAMETWTESDPKDIAARTALLERFIALHQRGSASPEEFTSVTRPETASLE